jgi:chemotaxis protein CheC
MSEARRPTEAEIDRVCELASIGAGHAADALAQLTGRTCEMRVPRVQRRPVDEPGLTGVLFELTGGTGGVLGLFFPAATRERLHDHLLGAERGAADSALREVGNILASHAVDAVAQVVGEAMLPSPPQLARTDAAAAFARLLVAHHGAAPALEVATEIVDRSGELRGIFVFAPDRPARVAAAGGF